LEKAEILLMVIFAIFAVIPLISGESSFFVVLAKNMLIMAILASAWNLLAYSGQGSLGHAAFFGVGGYVSALLSIKLGISPLITLWIAGLVASLLGLFVGLLVARLREWFLAMVTFGIPVILKTLTVSDLKIQILARLQSQLGGHDGLFPGYLARGIAEYYIIMGLSVLSIVFTAVVFNSKWGFAFSAIRDNELEARILGVNTTKYKLLAFCLSSYMAGVAGALFAHSTGYINPGIYGIEYSFNPVLYSVVGGMGTVAGPVIGTVVISLINEVLKDFGLTYLKNVIIGLIIILTVIFFPRGIAGMLNKRK